MLMSLLLLGVEQSQNMRGTVKICFTCDVCVVAFLFSLHNTGCDLLHEIYYGDYCLQNAIQSHPALVWYNLEHPQL